MHPDRDHAITIDPTLLQDEEDKTYEVKTPADKMEHSRILWIILVVAGFAYIIYYFATLEEGKTVASALNLNIVNFIFLFLGILLHGDPVPLCGRHRRGRCRRLGHPAAVPLLCRHHGHDDRPQRRGRLPGRCDLRLFCQHFHQRHLPPCGTFLSAGIVNFFVPSGGGQSGRSRAPSLCPPLPSWAWSLGRAAMAIAWGDQWTNMIQPFWVLPALGVAKLSARDIMGYLVIVLLFTGLVAILGFLAWGLFFA